MKQNPAYRLILTVVFIGLLASAAILSRSSAKKSEVAAGPHDAAGAISRHGFALTEVSKAMGVDFVHQAPKLHPSLDHIMPQVASMGAGVSIVDYDRDGWNDLYVTNSGEGSKNRLYRNQEGAGFKDVAEQAGVADLNQRGTGVSMGAIWGDYDNDGFEDLFVYKWGRPELFHNEGGKSFTRVTEAAGLPAWANANSAVWFDYDRDGRLDLFLGGYYRSDLDLWNLTSTRIMPESFEYAKNGGRKYLFRNLGEGKFSDVTAATGLESSRWALAAAAADLRGTGYPDLVIANDYAVSEFFANEGGKRFREIGKQVGIGERPKSGMNVAFGDIRNDGRFAMYITNISEEGVLVQGNNLWLPEPGTSGAGLKYVNMAEDMDVSLGGWSFGAQFGDLNNDGYSDLFLTNGYVSENDKSYWYDFSKIAGGNTAIIGDAANWPPMEGRSLSGHQRKRVWLNDGAGKFTDVASQVGVNETFDGRAVALADFSNTGVLDVVVAHQKAPLLVYKNSVSPDHDWIELELEGTQSNRSAIGAEVRVFWGGQQQLQQVSGASGFCAQNQRRLHFGLGQGAQIEKVQIRWPSGKEQTLTNLEARKLHRLKEPV
ncbi:MAG: CRTAC1 family protein [Actinomycetota bacterium]